MPGPRPDQGEIEAVLLARAEELLGLRPGRADPRLALVSQGFDSLMAVNLQHRIEADLGYSISIADLLAGATIEDVARDLASAEDDHDAPEVAGAAGFPRASGGRPERLPVSFAQRRLWFLEQLSPGRAYVIAGSARLEGVLDRGALGRALDALVVRHESLRTTFPSEGGVPFQRVHEPRGVVLRFTDLVRSAGESALVEVADADAAGAEVAGPAVLVEGAGAETADAAALAEVVEGELAVPFDLVEGPLLRTHLVRTGTDRHELVVVMHHIISDGWSLNVMLDDIARLYAEELEQKGGGLPALPIQYADFALWQREWAEGPRFGAQVEFWRERLADLPPTLELPTDHPRPSVSEHRGAVYSREIPEALGRELEVFARGREVTPFVVLEAAFAALLGRLSGQGDIVVGAPVANRSRAEVQGLIGFFVNTLALRTDLSDDPGFGALVERTRETVLSAHQHQDVPFEALVEALHPQRDLARNPLFQVMFAVQDEARARHPLPGVELSTSEVHTGTAKFDLTVTVERTGGAGPRVRWEYDRDLFEASTVARFAGFYETLLSGLLADPEQPLSRVPLMTGDQRDALLEAWNPGPAQSPPPAEAVSERIARRGVSDPDAVAVVAGDGRLTYGELNARADRLAAHLRSRGVGPDRLVGLCARRGIDLVVGIVAVLRSGGAYVPLDPTHPAERLRQIARDAAPVLILTHGDLREQWSGVAPVIDLEEPVDSAPELGDVAVHPGSLAYVIYTSGSTGVPKGVGVTHGNLSGFAVAMDVLLGGGRGQTWLAVTSPAFDISVLELVWTLSAGCRVVVLGEESGSVGEAVRIHGVTHVQTTPSFANRLLAEDAQALSGLDTLLLGGEAFPPSLVERLRTLSGTRVINGYGPTEATVYATSHDVAEGESQIPIGMPVVGGRVYTLDGRGVPVPPGVAGELSLAGHGIARGYVNRPGLTAERFVPDPFGPPGSRMYRTGDVTRHRADHGVDYLGRADHQVKVRGYRIELDDVTAALGRHPAVETALTTAVPQGEDLRLVGYVVCADGEVPPDLFAHLRRALPTWMHPDHIVALTELPLTPNGKIDRDRLPLPERGNRARQEHLAPATPTEVRLARLWSELLEVSDLGRDDDFFALGGHSLMATQVLARARAEFGVDLPLRAVFEHPTIAEFARFVDETAAGETGPAIVPRRRTGRAPLSFAQQRMRFLEQLSPGRTYVIAGSARLKGALDRAALGRALDALVARHESLRTTFPVFEDVPFQRVHEPAGAALRFTDLVGRVHGPALAEVVEGELAVPFDLVEGPLLRTHLVRTGTDRHELVVVMHHIISDGWSLNVMLDEIALLYRRELTGDAGPLSEPGVHYLDFALWQRDWAQGPEYREQLEFWRERLADPPPALELPTDHPRPPVSEHRGAVHVHPLPGRLAGAVDRFSHDHGATPFMTLEAAFTALLWRLSGQSDVVVGTPVANRSRAETQGLIGFFVNTLALRTDLSDDPGFDALVERTRETVLSAHQHQDVPFDHLVEHLQPQRDLARTPLFQVMFAVQEQFRTRFRLPGVELSTTEVHTGTAKFDLTVTVERESEGGLRVRWEYDRDLFEASTVARFAGFYETLLSSLLADPEQPVGAAMLMTEDQRDALLAAWNPAPEGVSPQEGAEPVDERIARRGVSDPDAVAVVAGDGRLTYGELNARADRLAAHLRSRGVGPDRLVGLCARRGIDLVVGIVAVLRSGGAYVPLDPTHPAERLRQILADAAPVLVLTEGPLVDALPDTGVPVVLMDTDLPQVTGPVPALARPHPGSLAYVIYTSGSTGVPKGVAVTHGNLSGFAVAMDVLLGGGRGQTWLAVTSPAFDISVLELVWTLSAGCRVVVLGEESGSVGEAVRIHGVTHVQTTPSFANRLLAEDLDHLSGLDTLLLGGEAFPPSLVERLRTLSGTRVINGYGPTEATVYATSHDLVEGESQIPIGMPVPGGRVYTLDGRGVPVPPGVAGELSLAGHGIARGYVNRPGLTAERFVPDPFGPPGSRMYRTGDVTRHRADHGVDYLGRADHQVKVRGYRIELDEVTHTLTRHPQVTDAVTVARATGDEEHALVGYVVCADGQVPPDLVAHLRRALPTWMHPDHVVALTELPLTPNGKIDRDRLPAPASEPIRPTEGPTTPTEERLVRIWRTLLDSDGLGRDDDFFALGGHSLMATQVLARARAEFGVDLPLRAVFEHPTVAELAEAIDRLDGADDLAGITAGGRPDQVPLSFAQRRLWFLEQLSPGRAYVIAGSARLEGALDRAALGRALDALVVRHESLRTTFPSEGGVPFQRVHEPRDVDLRFTDLDGAVGERALAAVTGAETADAAALAEVVEGELAVPFDLVEGPLLRTHLVRTGTDRHELVVVMHHIISDGWSLNVMIDELAQLYRHQVGEEGTEPADLPIQYADFALWQRAWAEGPRFGAQVEFWRERLADLPPTLELPTDHPRPPVSEHRGAVHVHSLPVQVTDAVDRFSRDHGATPFMTLEAAFAALLGRLSGQGDVVVGTPVANRSRPETQGLIGFFVNTLAVRTDLSDDPGFDELVERTRETVLSAHQHQDVPFEALVEALHPQRDLARNPLFQVMFTFRDAPVAGNGLPGVRVSLSDIDTGTATFDLTVTVERTGGAGLRVRWEYDRDLLEASTVARFAGFYETLLSGLLANPEQPVSRVPLMTEDQRDALLAAWNPETEGARSLASTEPVHERIARQAAADPDAVAVVAGDGRLTYGDLNTRADRLAAHLRSRGVGPDRLVGLCARRGVDLVVGIVAVLRSGGAYVPLDPDHPTERLRQILADAAPVLVLTESALVDALPDTGIPTALLDDAREVPATPEHRSATVHPQNLAYVIYTSGSTGAPKGVAVTHANLAASTAARERAYDRRPRGFLLVSSVAFDTSVASIFWSLCTGAALYLPDHGRGLDLDHLTGLLRAADISHLVCLPALYRLLLDKTADDPPALDTVILAGEPLPPALVLRHHDVSPDVELFNEYGPTEATVWSTFTRCRPDAEARSVPIGVPIPGARVYTLDGRGVPVPPGVAGELSLAGHGIARGYLNRPGLTAERFAPDPFGPPGSRMYRTGDVTRHRADHGVDYLGRADHQVKVRGYRIELDEVTHTLTRHPQVTDAVTVARATGDETRLVGYLVCDDPDTFPAADVRDHLRLHLPPWMHPAHLVPLRELPRTPNGKVDTARLPAPARPAPTAFHAPATPTEQRIADLWADLLDAPGIGRDDNFFDLGGNSLLLVRARELLLPLHGGLGVVDLFRCPTVRTLAALIEDSPPGDAQQALDPSPATERARRAGRRRQADRRRRLREDTHGGQA
ncbi:non-ribosomal peptide synthetase [Nocardiopsis aegyptia]|uniref:Amino acid adenylation domain-containing protein n=1 Tax=Nocardiopsis aegyptia TaxID=220378 RepID=A0A7Z0ETY6_9ACTN|nr:non-ribosomal peptide synthetase [Nocardiopsis aegyptia]NYJ37761.1 amino acid adenylation domain-containing protein [Nocardiopsis aegyptia]